MIKPSLMTLALLLTLTFSVNAQQRAMGLDFNPETFKTIPTFSTSGEKAMVPLPMAADLTQYAPPVGDQGNTPSCVAWSTAYGAFTVQYAAQKRLQDKAELQRVALSAMLPYRQLRPNCDRGLDLPNIAEYIQQNGDVAHAEFGSVNCGVPVSGDLLNRARQNRPIKEVIRLFDENNTNAEKIFRTREQVGRFSTPVIIGMQVTRKFINLKATDDGYRPEGEVIGLHAMTVVGYDGSSFKILNSWGPAWGKNGYFSIRFDDFARVVVGGVVLVLPDGYTPGPRPTNTVTKIGGTFGFQYYDQNAQFRPVSPRHIGNGVYELDRKDWTVGQQFQLLTKNSRQAQSMCVFSIDKDNVVNIHWPIAAELSGLQFGLTTGPVTDIQPNADYDLTIPANDELGRPQALNIEKAGTDYLCVLYSDKPLISQLSQILTRLKNASGDIYSRLQSALGSQLVPASNIRYEPGKMGASATTTQGNIVPLVLKVQSVN